MVVIKTKLECCLNTFLKFEMLYEIGIDSGLLPILLALRIEYCVDIYIHVL